MKFRIAAVIAVVLISGFGLPRALEPTLHAQNDLWFDVVMGPGEPVFRRSFAPVQGPDSTAYVSGQGGIVVLRNGAPADLFAPFGTSFRGPLSLAIGSFGGDGVDVILATTFDPSSQPLRIFMPGQPPAQVAETDVPAIATTGIRLAIADVDADRSPETIVGTGPGAPATISVVPMGETGEVITFSAFDPSFRGGVFVAAGDLNGDGKNEVIVSQGQGGEVGVWEIRGGQAHQRGRMRPQGHEYNGGFRVAAGDFNGDGVAEIITGAMTGQARVRVFDVSVPSGRLLVDTVVTDRPADPSQGGTPVAFGRFDHGPAALVAHFNSVYKITDPGDPRPRIFSENPFAVVASVFMDLQTYTPPPRQ